MYAEHNSGVSDTTVAKLLLEIGDIRRFSNADKLANFAGIAPVDFSSAEKGDDKSSKQGNRRLQERFISLRCRGFSYRQKVCRRILLSMCIIRDSRQGGKDQATGIDTDFPTTNQHHLRNAEKQDRIPDAGSTGK